MPIKAWCIAVFDWEFQWICSTWLSQQQQNVCCFFLNIWIDLCAVDSTFSHFIRKLQPICTLLHEVSSWQFWYNLFADTGNMLTLQRTFCRGCQFLHHNDDESFFKCFTSQNVCVVENKIIATYKPNFLISRNIFD